MSRQLTRGLRPLIVLRLQPVVVTRSTSSAAAQRLLDSITPPLALLPLVTAWETSAHGLGLIANQAVEPGCTLLTLPSTCVLAVPASDATRLPGSAADYDAYWEAWGAANKAPPASLKDFLVSPQAAETLKLALFLTWVVKQQRQLPPLWNNYILTLPSLPQLCTLACYEGDDELDWLQVPLLKALALRSRQEQTLDPGALIPEP